jgi:dihydroorotase-like cyclic amidohydrolase
MLDTRVVGGTLVSPGGTSDLDLGILDGRIVGVYERGTGPDARKTVEADGLLVLPGIVDVHFHCRAPGFPEREDFDSGTQAAAARPNGTLQRWRRPVRLASSSSCMPCRLGGRSVGARIHFPHISTARATELIADARRWGQSVTVETCPHYLLVDWATVERLGPHAKINPPIRPDAERTALWDALGDRRVDIVASDHAPYSAVDKEIGWVDIFKSTSGYPGIETMGPLLFDRALNGQTSLSRAVELLSSRPAEVFGLARKGSLQPGADADLLLLDPNASWTIEPDQLFTRSKASARLFAGRALRGRIVATYLRGEAAFAGGEIANAPGTGRFVRPD